MLPKKQRAKKGDFLNIKPKTVIRSDLFDIAKTSIKKDVFACIISKKTLKKSVERNKLRRRIFYILNKNKIIKNEFVIIYPKSKSLREEFKVLENELIKSLNKI